MKYLIFFCFLLPFSGFAQNQLQWIKVDSAYAILPTSMHVYFTEQAIDSFPFKAFYAIADLKDKSIQFDVDTTHNRRLTPSGFYEKNNAPLLVVNGTFFSFETNRNLNLVIKNKNAVSFNQHTIIGRGKDTFTYRHPVASAIGISKKRTADVAWTISDSNSNKAFATQVVLAPIKDSVDQHELDYYLSSGNKYSNKMGKAGFRKWKMQTAIGGGPVLLQEGKIAITNNEELKFAGKAINDKHPRTAMGYTADNQLIIMAVEGRNKEAGGATLIQLAKILQDLGCVEALNLDGGGSSCLLVNGKETIKPSDASGQRPIPAVFLIKRK